MPEPHPAGGATADAPPTPHRSTRDQILAMEHEGQGQRQSWPLLELANGGKAPDSMCCCRQRDEGT
jgi:hypothetical protein